MTRSRAARRRATAFGACCGALALCSGNAYADLHYSIGAGVSNSDNISRVSTGEIEASAANIATQIDWLHDGRRFDADVDINASYLDYFEGPYESDLVGGGNARLDFGIVPDRLSWVLQDSFGQAVLDPLEAVTVENQENVNYLTTGPTGTIKVGGNARMQLAALYSITDYEVSPLDDQRLRGVFSTIWDRSSSVSYSVNVFGESTEFDDSTVGDDYKHYGVYAGYTAQLARTVVSANLGYNQIQMDLIDDPNFTEGAPLVQLEVTRTLSPSTELRLQLGSIYTNSSEALRDGEVGPLEISPGERPDSSSDPYLNRRALLEWELNRARTSILLGVTYTHEDYTLSNDLDRDSVIWRATFERHLRPTLRFRVFGQYTDEKFDTQDFDSQEMRYGAVLGWAIGRAWSIDLSWEQFSRDATTADRGFDEQRMMLSIMHTGPTRRTAAAPAAPAVPPAQ